MDEHVQVALPTAYGQRHHYVKTVCLIEPYNLRSIGEGLVKIKDQKI